MPLPENIIILFYWTAPWHRFFVYDRRGGFHIRLSSGGTARADVESAPTIQ